MIDKYIHKKWFRIFNFSYKINNIFWFSLVPRKIDYLFYFNILPIPSTKLIILERRLDLAGLLACESLLSDEDQEFLEVLEVLAVGDFSSSATNSKDPLLLFFLLALADFAVKSSLSSSTLVSLTLNRSCFSKTIKVINKHLIILESTDKMSSGVV